MTSPTPTDRPRRRIINWYWVPAGIVAFAREWMIEGLAGAAVIAAAGLILGLAGRLESRWIGQPKNVKELAEREAQFFFAFLALFFVVCGAVFLVLH